MLDRETAMKYMKQAHRTPRCVHIKPDGVQCGSPALKNCAYCYAHARLAMRHPHNLSMPLLEDANSVQSAIMEVMRALLDGELDRRTAGLLLYGLQMASCNLKYVCFEPKDPRTVVRDASNLQPYCDFVEDERAEPEPEQNSTPIVASEPGGESSSLGLAANDNVPLETSVATDFSINRSPDLSRVAVDHPTCPGEPRITISGVEVPHHVGIKSAGEMLHAITELH